MSMFKTLLRRIRIACLALKHDLLHLAIHEVSLGTWLWSDLATRRKIQAQGINVVPANFYCDLPTIAEIESSFEYQGEQPPYALPVDADALRQELQDLSVFAGEFEPAKLSESLPRDGVQWGGTMFPYVDALAYYCYLRKHRPRTVVEFGSGFSSQVALQALKKNGGGRLICVEPFPRDFLSKEPGLELVQKPAQAIDAEYMHSVLADGDVMFIDSTHTVKSGSDCLHLYLRLLPAIQRRIHVHVHDVYLPFALPKNWLLQRQIFWTEQYLLLALLQDNPRATIRYGASYHRWRNPELLESFMAGKGEIIGGSFWFEYRPAASLKG